MKKMRKQFLSVMQAESLSPRRELHTESFSDLGLLPCERDGGNRRVFNEESYKRVDEAKATAEF